MGDDKRGVMSDEQVANFLVRIRVELYTAAQCLTGKSAEEFWALLGEIQSVGVIRQPGPVSTE